MGAWSPAVRFVAVHGLGCQADQGWPRVAAALAPEHTLEAIPLDGADGPTSTPPSAWTLAEQARRVASRLQGDEVLVGHSMGGAIAIRAAQLVRPKALVLVEPHVVPSAGFVVRPALAAGPDPRPAERATFDAAMSRIRTGEGTYADAIRRWDWRVFHAYSRQLADGDGEPWVDAVAELACPVHLLWGGDSPRRDIHLDALRAVGLEPRFVGRGHFIPSEAPAALASFLRDIAA